jgi:putative MATE family efflux protein
MAWPIIGENLLETLLGIVDTVLVAGLGIAAIAGVGSAQQILFFLLTALSGLSIGSSILVAQAVGARDLAGASRFVRQSLLWSIVLSVPLALLGYAFAGPVIGIFGVAPDVAEVGTDYLQVTMGTVVVLVALVIGSGALRGAGDSRTPMVVTAIANVVHVVLAYGLIYGYWGLPALGAVGSAWATFLARALALVLLLGALWKGRNGVSIAGRAGWRPDWSVARRVLNLGVPASVEQMLTSTGFLVLTIMVAHLGTDSLAAQRISMSALSFSFLPGIGFAIAATALVGQSIGACRPREGAAAAKVATTWAMVWMGTIGVLLLVGAEVIMRLFTADPNVVRIGAAALRVVALTQPLLGLGMVQSGALRGTGDTRFPLLIGGLSMWCTVALAWLLLRFVGGGLTLVWVAFLLTSPLVPVLSWRRFRRRVSDLEAESVIGVRPQALGHPEAG